MASTKVKESLKSPKQDDDLVEMKKSNKEEISVESSVEENEKVEDYNDYQAVVAKFDADNTSAITFLTGVTSNLTSHPLSVSTSALTSSSKIELQLVYLAKELEREKTRRETL